MIQLIFEKLRLLSGGKLTQKQVDASNIAIAKASENVLANMFGVALHHKMVVSDAGVALICSFEGLRLAAYDDGVGVWSIGFGTTRYPDGRMVKQGDSCTLAQAKSYMAHDLEKFAFVVNNLVVVPITQHQFDALVSLTYNIGIKAFKESTLLKLLNNADYQAASAQFEVWNRAGGKILQGLINRRQVERKLFNKV